MPAPRVVKGTNSRSSVAVPRQDSRLEFTFFRCRRPEMNVADRRLHAMLLNQLDPDAANSGVAKRRVNSCCYAQTRRVDSLCISACLMAANTQLPCAFRFNDTSIRTYWRAGDKFLSLLHIAVVRGMLLCPAETAFDLPDVPWHILQKI